MATLPGHGAESQALPFAQRLQSAAAAGGTLPLQGTASSTCRAQSPRLSPQSAFHRWTRVRLLLVQTERGVQQNNKDKKAGNL